MEPRRGLVTSIALDLVTGLSSDPGGPRAGRGLDASWTFVLPGTGRSGYRLIAGLCAILELVHSVVERRMLLGVKQRAEAAVASSDVGPQALY